MQLPLMAKLRPTPPPSRSPPPQWPVTGSFTDADSGTQCRWSKFRKRRNFFSRSAAPARASASEEVGSPCPPCRHGRWAFAPRASGTCSADTRRGRRSGRRIGQRRCRRHSQSTRPATHVPRTATVTCIFVSARMPVSVIADRPFSSSAGSARPCNSRLVVRAHGQPDAPCPTMSGGVTA